MFETSDVFEAEARVRGRKEAAVSETPKFVTKDSGQRAKFDTGAVRDTQEGKPRYEEIPIPFLKELALKLESEPDARLDLVPVRALLRVAALYGRGAKKYAPRNWEKGMPLKRALASLLRHAFQWAEGDREEDHLAAVAWNAFALMFYEEAIQNGELPAELDDLNILCVPETTKES